MNTKILILLIIVFNTAFAQTGGDFALEKSTIAAGGGQSNGGDIKLNGSIGQHDAIKESTGGNFSLKGGFWVAKTTVNQPEIIFTNGFEN